MNIKSKLAQIRIILSKKENKHEKHYTMFPDKHKMESIMVYNIKDKIINDGSDQYAYLFVDLNPRLGTSFVNSDWHA